MTSADAAEGLAGRTSWVREVRAREDSLRGTFLAPVRALWDHALHTQLTDVHLFDEELDMHSYTRWALGTALALSAGCTPKDKAVTTTTDQGTSSSPSGEMAAQRDHSMIRVVNAVPSGPKITLLADERTIFDNVAGSEVTPYKEMGDNAVKFSVRRSDQPSAAGEAVNREVMGDG